MASHEGAACRRGDLSAGQDGWPGRRGGRTAPGADRSRRRGAPAAARAARHRRRGAAPDDGVRVRAAVWRRAHRAAPRTHAVQRRASLRRRRALLVPPPRWPVPNRRRQRVGRQPAAIRAAGLGWRSSGSWRARPRVDAAGAARPRLARRDGVRMDGCASGTDGRFGVHCAQPGLPGPVSARRLRTARPAGTHDAFARTRIPRPVVVHEGRIEIRAPHHHREPDLRPRDRNA